MHALPRLLCVGMRAHAALQVPAAQAQRAAARACGAPERQPRVRRARRVVPHLPVAGAAARTALARLSRVPHTPAHTACF